MNLHKDPGIFKDAIRATADHKNIREIYVEKDYWVTFVLHAIFHSKMKDVAVFKGGTSLSKCYQAINRFSEDIDIVVFSDESMSNNQMDKRVKKVSKVVGDTILKEVKSDVTNKGGNFRKIAYAYDKSGFNQDFGQVRDKIVVEVSRLGHFEPHEELEVHSLIVEMMRDRGQEGLIEEYGLMPFPLKVLSIKRTFCEKIMSLVRFSNSEQPYDDLRNKIRHTYDIHMLLKKSSVRQFFNSEELDRMLVRVAKDDIKSYGDQYDWLHKHPASALIFDKPEESWNKIKAVYNGTFKELVIGDLPPGDEVLKDLEKVSSRIEKIDWLLE